MLTLWPLNKVAQFSMSKSGYKFVQSATKIWVGKRMWMTDIASNVSVATASITEPTRRSELTKPLFNSPAICHRCRSSASPPLSSHELELESKIPRGCSPSSKTLKESKVKFCASRRSLSTPINSHLVWRPKISAASLRHGRTVWLDYL